MAGNDGVMQRRIRLLLSVVGRVTGCPPWLMRSGSRRPLAAQGRAVAAIAMRDRLGLSTTQIADALARRQSSVVELIQAHEPMPETRRLLERLDAELARIASGLSETKSVCFAGHEQPKVKSEP